MKTIVILGKNEENRFETLSNSLKENFDGINIFTVETPENIPSETDLVILWKYNDLLEKEIIDKHNIIRIHPSLLPAFNTSAAILDAYKSGVKVSGVTIHRVENTDLNGLILAQYPIIIDNYTHYDGFKSEIEDLEIKLAVPTIKSILQDKIFDIVDFLNNNDNRSCNNCSGCNNHCCNK